MGHLSLCWTSSFNDLAYIGPAAFSGLVSLRTLYIGATNLSSLHLDAFSGMNNLTELFISHNTYLSSIQAGTFAPLHLLARLDLTFSPVDIVPGLFRGLNNLRFMDLSRSVSSVIYIGSLVHLRA